MQEQSVEGWLAALAARQPTPGGGAAAGLMAATAAALLGMVSNFTTGEKWADRQTRMRQFSGELEQLRKKALKLAGDDAEAFAQVSAAYKMPIGQEKTLAIQKALIQAAEPPIKTAQLAAELIPIAQKLARDGNPNVISDVAVAASCARAALEAAIVNIEINSRSIKDSHVKKMLGGEIQKAEKAINEFEKIFQEVQGAINGSGRHSRRDPPSLKLRRTGRGSS